MGHTFCCGHLKIRKIGFGTARREDTLFWDKPVWHHSNGGLQQWCMNL